jgi:predicted unusual protein kinase regulating ubiquinone biosynthesis (AarF/ABC1/UbiB family)
MSTKSTPRNRAVRFLRTGSVLARVFVGYKTITLRERLRGSDWAEAKRVRHHRWSAERLYRTALDLEGLLIKIGQFLGARSDVMPEEYVDVLSRLHDQVPPEPFPEVKKLIEGELDRPLAEVYAEFEETPIASASLAQVHRARLTDGTPVAVKVQYPHIRDIVAIDLANVSFFVGALNRMDRSFDYSFMVEEMQANIPKELDFINEGRNAERVASDFAGYANILSPAIHWEYTTERVLTMEYMEGIKITDLEAMDAAGIDRREVARLLMEAYAHQIMRGGFFHADPHPGNLMVRQGPQIVFVDFGQAKELSPEFRKMFQALTKAVFDSDDDTMAQAFRGLGIRTKSDDHEGYVALGNAYVGDIVRGSADRGYITLEQANDSYQDAIKLVRANPIVGFPPELLLVGRVFGLLSGISKHLDAQTDLREVFEPFLTDAEFPEAHAEQPA